MPGTYADAAAAQALERTIAARAGRPYPERITLALDSRALDGPEVDVACGAVEPAVDRWETGEEVPTRPQLELLAELTGYPLAFFFTEPGPPLTGGFMCVRSGKGRGCYSLAEDLPTQLDLTPAPPRRPRAPLPDAPPPGELPECSGPCGRPMRRDTWRRQHGRCSRCGPAV